MVDYILVTNITDNLVVSNIFTLTVDVVMGDWAMWSLLTESVVNGPINLNLPPQ